MAKGIHIYQCPECKKIDGENAEIYVQFNSPITRGNNTEILFPAYCAECGYSWYLVYQPDYTEDRG